MVNHVIEITYKLFIYMFHVKNPELEVDAWFQYNIPLFIRILALNKNFIGRKTVSICINWIKEIVLIHRYIINNNK